MRVGIVIVAGGSGSRMGGDRNKIFLPIRGRPMLVWSVETLYSCTGVERLIVVARARDHAEVASLCVDWPVDIVAGGATRHQSEANGIEAMAVDDLDIIAVHDAARPLVPRQLAESVIETAFGVGGAVPGLPLGVPVFQKGTLLDPAIHVRAQTPQAFRARPLVEAFRSAAAQGFEGVDTAETAQRFSTLEIALVPGADANLKVTRPGDVAAVENYGSGS